MRTDDFIDEVLNLGFTVTERDGRLEIEDGDIWYGWVDLRKQNTWSIKERIHHPRKDGSYRLRTEDDVLLEALIDLMAVYADTKIGDRI